MIYAKRDIELGDEITYGKWFHLTTITLTDLLPCVQIITFLLSKTRFLVSAVLSNVVAISIRLVHLFYIFLIPLAVIVPFSALHLVFVLSICFLWTVRPDIALLNTFFWGLTSKIYRF